MEIKMAPCGIPTVQDEYSLDYMTMFEDFIVQASPKVREEIKKRVEKAIANEDRFNGWAKPYVDWSRATDLGSMLGGWGPHYLYVWLNGNNVPFYAGQARDRRRVEHFTSTTRSQRFKDIVRKGGCHAVVVAKHIPGSKINDLERGLIAYLKWEGYPVVNDKDLPSQRECSMAKRVAKAGNFTMQQVFLSGTEYENDFAKIFAVLNEALCVGWTGEYAVLT